MKGHAGKRDVWAGLFFAVVGLSAVYIASGYDVGEATSMGPGYFPILIGGGLGLIGTITLIRGLIIADTARIGRFAFRPLLVIPLSVLAFAASLNQHGLIVAALALVIICRLAARDFRPLELIPLCLVLCAAAGALFIYGLGLPPELVLPR